MAKDDYYFIVYQILSYLYKCLKDGKDADPQELLPGRLYDINQKYWEYIIEHLQEGGLVEGMSISHYIDGSVGLGKGCLITPKGIAYIFDNNLMAKAKKIVNKAIEIAPLVLG